LGEGGAYIQTAQQQAHIPAPKVNAIDTTAAGDVFNGALAVALTEGLDIFKATAVACKAAAISTTKRGSQSSAPNRKELMRG
jgi:ribokinase